MKNSIKKLGNDLHAIMKITVKRTSSMFNGDVWAMLTIATFIISVPFCMWISQYTIGRGLMLYGTLCGLVNYAVIATPMKGNWFRKMNLCIYKEMMTPKMMKFAIGTLLILSAAMLLAGHSFIGSMLALTTLLEIKVYSDVKNYTPKP